MKIIYKEDTYFKQITCNWNILYLILSLVFISLSFLDQINFSLLSTLKLQLKDVELDNCTSGVLTASILLTLPVKVSLLMRLEYAVSVSQSTI